MTQTQEIHSTAELDENQVWHAFPVIDFVESETARCGFRPKQKEGEPFISPPADAQLCQICLALATFQ